MGYSEVALQQVHERRLLIDQVDLWLYEEVVPYLGKRILEIGCGLGNLARYLTDRELYVGTDLSSESVAAVIETFSSLPNMRAYVADVTDSTFTELAHLNFDTVISLNVFEHIEDDVLALQNTRKVLQPDGKLILVVPAHDSLYGTMDRSIGHYRRYSKRRMIDTLSHARLTCVRQRYINAFGALGWLVKRANSRQEVPPSGQLRSFNHLVPLLKRLERSVNMPFGISS